MRGAFALGLLFVFAALTATRGYARAEADAAAEPGARDDGWVAASEKDATPGPVVARGPGRPPQSAKGARACSFRHPICVNAARRIAPDVALAVLDAADRAWDSITGSLGLPAPDPDPDTRAYDVYFADLGGRGAMTLFGERDVRSRVDRASAFTLLDNRVTRGCALDALVAREVARASLFRAAPATDEGTARAQTTYLAQLMVPCAMSETADGAAFFQSHPERGFADAWPESDARAGAAFAAGASLFHGWLDYSFGRAPGSLVRATWALAPTMTELSAFRWHNEPDSFDVLRETFKNSLSNGSTLDDLLLEFGVARAFFGAADDGAHYPESRTLGEAARLRRDWEIEWPQKPRRLSSPAAGLAPLGMTCIAMKRDGAARGARLRVEAAWEQHAKMKWAVVKLDARGKEIGHLVVPSHDRAVEAQMTVVDLDDVASLLLIGVATGDGLYPFDPDDEAWEPHGWLLTVASE